ncbi:MAG: hypothetical protein M0Q92_06950 [Methanoregula sp.]|jgi:hypothetical protein|nr:hypothetical protein [Methanoregula sp.]
MAADEYNDENDDFDTPHLPERYHQIVRAKKRQRLKKHILMAGVGILIIVIMYLLMSWAAGGLISSIPPQSTTSPDIRPVDTVVPSQTTQPAQNIDVNTTPAFASGTDINRPTVPVIDSARAQKIAEQYIIEQNSGQLPLKMSRSEYEQIALPSGTVAGQYIIEYERIYQDYPTDVDGFTVIVDAVSGEVVEYTHQWTTQEYAFSTYSQLGVTRLEATFAVMQKAKEQYPDDIDTLQIRSADIRWKNNVPDGTVPRPGSIPLAWKVVFDDDTIRTSASAKPGVAWVDVQTGEFIAFDYQH